MDKLNLITEVEDFSIEVLTESTDDKRTLYVEGVAMQADILNSNRRIYPKALLSESVQRYIDKYVSQSQALGECDHPPRPQVLLKEASHLIESLSWSGNNVHARAKILPTPNGLTARALIEGGWKPRVSSRGVGSTRTLMESGNKYDRVERYEITSAFDFVLNQSAPGAIMAGIYESVGGIYVPRAQQETVDWDKVAHKFKSLIGVNNKLVVENQDSDQLRLVVRGDTLVIECSTEKWDISLKDMKKLIG